MKQRINLYRENNSPTSFDINSLSGSVTIVIAVISIVFLSGLGLKFFDESLKSDLAKLKETKANREAEVQMLQDKFSSQTVSSDLQAEIERVKNQINSRQDLMSLLDQIDPQQTLNFSSYLSALAESSRSESWLNSFSINTSDRSFTIVGGAVNGPAVSSLLEAIAKTTPFSDMAVTGLEVESVDSGVQFQAEAELSVND